jgi:hypothetical protein
MYCIHFLRALSVDVKCEQNIMGYVTAIKYHIYSLYSYPPAHVVCFGNNLV